MPSLFNFLCLVLPYPSQSSCSRILANLWPRNIWHCLPTVAPITRSTYCTHVVALLPKNEQYFARLLVPPPRSTSTGTRRAAARGTSSSKVASTSASPGQPCLLSLSFISSTHHRTSRAGSFVEINHQRGRALIAIPLPGRGLLQNKQQCAFESHSTAVQLLPLFGGRSRRPL